MNSWLNKKNLYLHRQRDRILPHTTNTKSFSSTYNAHFFVASTVTNSREAVEGGKENILELVQKKDIEKENKIKKNNIHPKTPQKVHNTSQIGGIYTRFEDLK